MVFLLGLTAFGASSLGIAGVLFVRSLDRMVGADGEDALPFSSMP